MGLWDSIRGLFKGEGASAGGERGVDELARRLGVGEAELRAIEPRYRPFAVRKRSGLQRIIDEPEADLKRVQRLILRRLLRRLRAHPAAHGFERGRSIVTAALPHARRAVVLRMDVQDFFLSTKAQRVEAYFRRIGWGAEAAALLTRLCTSRGGLPQGAPTSPRLSNLVNFRLDARLAALARAHGASYTRYADDMTFSFASDEHETIVNVIQTTKKALRDEGYRLYTERKLRVLRPHMRQTVAGLVVNERVGLPRATRRWLRAVEHRAASGRETTLTPAQLQGWRALRHMIEEQSNRQVP
ncbi:MAG TPA: reverse transcriptase family protein [Pyrinomonadaceae bacterium]|nr:reverse transcriptase family protein [Pyrinomonadaceae bacterium]